ncbi:cytochrome P450 [Dothidotthia symphoricarpi CBS 119687]|uniref:Cytochrome P450 n=1 Tax=Dothidotthia symphoricarpi CBS 119687 TaxID=1392245 RepID=A0A6A6AC68_9PLEO|nr:cytochrome P450 [Dothidotthia symphoricarpi CBS 119687]KAF2128498.1 cytochrome P450 [Dothidotthia symphoricarpi CBS 119687]
MYSQLTVLAKRVLSYPNRILFPGPFWVKVSIVPAWWHTWNEDRHIWLLHLQDRYAYGHIFGPKGNVKKGEYYQVWPRTVDSLNTWTTTDISVHAHMRRVLNHAFSENALRGAEAFIQTNSYEDWIGPINMADQVTYLVFDILGDLCFGRCLDMKETNRTLRHKPDMVIGFMELLHPVCAAELVTRGLDRLLAIATLPAIENWGNFVENCRESRSERQNELDESGTGSELLVIAGSDTSSTVIAATFFYLRRTPHVQKLQSCKYLTVFIQEGLRMALPVSAEPSREVLKGGTVVSYSPKGSMVSTAFWAVQYNQDYHPEPLKFRPERWVTGAAGSTKESVALSESAFYAFSMGSRGCVGKNMAWLEMRIIGAKVIWKFEFEQDMFNKLGGGTVHGRHGRHQEGQYQTYEISVSSRKGPVYLNERA